MVNVKMRQDFLSALNDAVDQCGVDRSQFIRDAISEKLRLLGITLPPVISRAASRLGKGGRPRREPAPTRKTEDSPEEIPVKVVEHVPSPVGPDYECAVDRYMRRRVREARKGKQASGSGVAFPSDAPRG